MTEYLIKTEYALSNRSSCRGCNDKILKGTLRVAIVVDIDCKYFLILRIE
jgi:hypothetical protein